MLSQTYEETEINGKNNEDNSDTSIWSDELMLLANQETTTASSKKIEQHATSMFPS